MTKSPERALRVGTYVEVYPERLEDAAIALCAREIYIQFGHHLCVDSKRVGQERPRLYTMRLGAGEDFACNRKGHGVIRVVNTRARDVLQARGWRPGEGKQDLQPPQNVCLRCPRLWDCTLEGYLPPALTR